MSGIVVADSGPLHYLVLIHCSEILRQLFDRIIVPHAVRDELLHGNTPQIVKDWINTPKHWLEFRAVEQPQDIGGIHRGEAEALQLALQVRASAVLIDDMDGRAVAKKLGLPVIGTIGILERAAEKSLVDLPSAVSALKMTNFFVSTAVLDAVLARHQSRRGNKFTES